MSGNLYYCYSLGLKRFLKENGLRYETVALHPNSKNLFWAYMKSEKLDRLLDEWSNNKRATFVDK